METVSQLRRIAEVAHEPLDDYTLGKVEVLLSTLLQFPGLTPSDKDFEDRIKELYERWIGRAETIVRGNTVVETDAAVYRSIMAVQGDACLVSVATEQNIDDSGRSRGISD